MQRKILKYRLSRQGMNRIEVPNGSKLLTAQGRDADVYVWFTSPTTSEGLFTQKINVIGTGWPYESDDGEYLCTTSTEDGLYTWHIFNMGMEPSVTT